MQQNHTETKIFRPQRVGRSKFELKSQPLESTADVVVQQPSSLLWCGRHTRVSAAQYNHHNNIT